MPKSLVVCCDADVDDNGVEPPMVQPDVRNSVASQLISACRAPCEHELNVPELRRLPLVSRVRNVQRLSGPVTQRVRHRTMILRPIPAQRRRAG